MEEEEELIKQRLTKKVNDCLVDCGTNELTSKLHERQNEGPASCPEFLAFEGNFSDWLCADKHSPRLARGKLKKKTTQAEQQQGEQYTAISSHLLSNKHLFKTSREK